MMHFRKRAFFSRKSSAAPQRARTGGGASQRALLATAFTTAFTTVLTALLITALCALAACSDATMPTISIDAAILRNLGSMHVGDVRRLTFTQLDTGGLVLPATSDGAQYLVVVANVASNTDDIPQYAVAGSLLTDGPALASVSPISVGTANRLSARLASHAAIAPTPTTLRAGVPSRPVPHPIVPPTAARIEARIRQYERQRLNPFIANQSIASTSRTPALRRALVRPVPTPGETLTLHTLDGSGLGGTSTSLCELYTSTTATVRAVSNHAIVAVDTRSPTGGFSASDFQTIANEFDTLIYPTDVSYFGAPTDLDQNGRVIILYTPAVNQLTPEGTASTQGFVGGFFFAGDLFSPSQCPESNQGELFYLLAPDPRGQFGNRFSTTVVRQMTRGTIAHEFQHMINAGNRIQNKARLLESTWLDEALAHFAEDAVGRVAAGLSPQQTMTTADLLAMPDSNADAFFFQNLARARYYVTEPDTVSAIVSHARAAYDLAARGAEWAFLRYVADWYAHGDAHALIQHLAFGPDTGSANLVKQTGAPLDSMLGNWLVTLYTDHQDIPNLPAKFNYTSYTMRDLISTVDAGIAQSYLPVDTLNDGSTTLTVGVPASSAAYLFVDQSAGAPRSFKLRTLTGAVPIDPNGRIYIVRVH